jgi:hypothetical protein
MRILIGTLMNADKLVRVFEWQWPQEHSMEDGEYCDGAANSYGQREDGRERKTGRVFQLAKGMTETSNIEHEQIPYSWIAPHPPQWTALKYIEKDDLAHEK